MHTLTRAISPEASLELPRAIQLSDVDATVSALVARFARTATERDWAGGTPKEQRDDIRRSGLLSLTIPGDMGGLGGDWEQTLAVARRLARVDSSLAHLFAFHHLMLATTQLFGCPAQWRPWWERTAQLDWFWGNALNPLDRRTVCRDRQGHHEFSGKKSFCSGAADSEMLIASAYAEDGQTLVVAAIPTSRSGITVLQDWDNMGQRQTDSGSVHFDRVRVHEEELLRDPGPLTTPRACLRPLVAQLILVNIYIGIAEGAFEEARRYALHEARSWQSGLPVTDDPGLHATFGTFHAGLEAMRVLGDRAGARLDAALQRGTALTEAERGELALCIAAAKVTASRTGLDICSNIFDVTGARSTHAGLGLDRYWRNLRTHTLHDPVQRKLQELGQWVLEHRYPTPGFYS